MLPVSTNSFIYSSSLTTFSPGMKSLIRNHGVDEDPQPLHPLGWGKARPLKVDQPPQRLNVLHHLARHTTGLLKGAYHCEAPVIQQVTQPLPTASPQSAELPRQYREDRHQPLVSERKCVGPHIHLLSLLRYGVTLRLPQLKVHQLLQERLR